VVFLFVLYWLITSWFSTISTPKRRIAMRTILMLLVFLTSASAMTPAELRARKASEAKSSRKITVLDSQLTAAQTRAAELERQVASLQKQLATAKSEAASAKQAFSTEKTTCSKEVIDLLAAYDAKEEELSKCQGGAK